MAYALKKHSTIQDWLFYPWPDMSNLRWIGVMHILTLQMTLFLQFWLKLKELKGRVLCNKLLLHKTGFVQLALPLINLHTSACCSFANNQKAKFMISGPKPCNVCGFINHSSFMDRWFLGITDGAVNPLKVLSRIKNRSTKGLLWMMKKGG